MGIREFSDLFDIIANSYSSSSGELLFDEYEKSIFLTQAQEQLVVELYSGRNTNGVSFEQSEELRSYLRNLIKTDTLVEDNREHKGISKYSKFFICPKDVLFITYEAATISDELAGCKNDSVISIIPVTQDEFYRIVHNPFRGPNTRRALRLDGDTDVLEVVSKYNIKDYTIRYLSKPTPIILEDISEMGLEIDGESNITECKLDSAMHRNILERAVALAIASRSIQSNK